MKDNSQPESPHPDETQTFTQILVFNKNRESWAAAKQKNTSPLPKKHSFCSNFFSSSDQTGVCKYQVATILTAKPGPHGEGEAGGEKPTLK